MGLILAPTTPAWTLEDTSSTKGANRVEKASATVTNEAVVAKEKPVANESSKKPLEVASGGNIQVNAPCLGVTSTNEYYGRWKRLGSNQAKCKEGASGQPAELILRSVCRIATINDGNFNNAMVLGPDQCIK